MPTRNKSIFDTLPSLRKGTPVTVQDEFLTYIGTGPEKTDDAIGWWIDNSARFPTLSRMALDYLTIPGTLAFVYEWKCTSDDHFYQQLLLMLSAPSAGAVSSCRILETDLWRSPHGPFYV
jgi:hypothetical protein